MNQTTAIETEEKHIGPQIRLVIESLLSGGTDMGLLDRSDPELSILV